MNPNTKCNKEKKLQLCIYQRKVEIRTGFGSRIEGCKLFLCFLLSKHPTHVSWSQRAKGSSIPSISINDYNFLTLLATSSGKHFWSPGSCLF